MAKMTPQPTTGDLITRRIDEAIADSLAERELRYQAGTAFVPGDMPDYERSVVRYLSEGKPVVVVYPDDSERTFLPGPSSNAA